MWLVHKNKFLIKYWLCIRGWTGNTSCQFCHSQEDVNHLFLDCYFARHIWFHLGKCQQLIQHWHYLDDLVMYALSLNKTSRTAFLMVVSATILCIWKQINDLCFNNYVTHSGRSVLLNTISLVTYWIGPMFDEVKQEHKSGSHKTWMQSPSR